MKYERDTTVWGKLRDATAWRVANFALNRIATPWYRAMISGSIIYGLDAAVKDSEK